MQQNLLVVGHHRRIGVSSTVERHSSPPIYSIKFQKFPIPIGIFSLQIFLLLILCAPLAMSVPGIPESWEKCSDQGICLNKGKCFTDGISEFCHCEDGYGGQKCERLLDAIFFSETPEQLSRLCKIAFLLGIFALFVAIFGWTCCCMKHLNARKLYLQNLKLARENQRLSKRTIRLYAALARAKGLIGVEEEENIRIQQQIISSSDLTPADEYASGGPIHSSNRPNSSSDSRHSFGQTNVNANPNHRILMRELSEMHDELRKSIEGVDRILEIKEKDGGEVQDGEATMMPNWKWNWQRLRGRILLLKTFNGRKDVDCEVGECERLENGNNNNNRESQMNEKNKSIFVRILNR